MSVTRDTFLAVKHYDKLILQQGVPLIDADSNEAQDITRNKLHTLIKQAIGDGFVNDGFKIVGTGILNDFTIKAGDGFVNGRTATKEVDETYKVQADYPTPAILAAPATGSRTDVVYLHIYEEVITGVADPDIIDPTYGAETCERVKLRYRVEVAAGGTTPVNTATDWYTPLASIARVSGQDSILVGDVTDLRAKVTVPLNMLPAVSAEITSARGSTASVDSRLSVSLNSDGTLKTELIAHGNLSDMPDTTGINSDHDIRYSLGAGGGTSAAHNKTILADQSSNANGAGLIGNFSVDQDSVPSDAATTVYGRLSQLAAQIKLVMGTANWYDAVATPLTALWGKFNSTTGHAHTGGTDDAPQVTVSGIADSAIETAKIKDLAVTNSKLAGSITADKMMTTPLTAGAVNLVPTASIQMFGGAAAPTGWLLCDGAAIDRTTYNSLFLIIGTIYGVGNNTTTFNLPDLRGRVPLGMGAGVGLTTRALNNQGGVESVTLSAAQSGLPDHTHTYQWAPPTGDGGSTGATRGSIQTVATSGVAGGAKPASASHENMPPYTVVNYIIKY